MVDPLKGDSSMGRRQLLQLILLHTAWEMGSGQLHYSVPEESQHGTFVGRIAQDLGLEVEELMPRMFRMESQGAGDYFKVNEQNGILFVNSRVDREELCGKSPICTIHLEVIVDKPLRVFHVEVEIADINDNAPLFSVREQSIAILESRVQGSYFPIEAASDADIGSNGQVTYKLTPNEYFSVEDIKNNEDSKSLVLTLNKPLDREESPEHHLLLSATDSGQPALTGTVLLVISVVDINDNAPAFNQSVYKIKLLENSPISTLVVKLEARDMDDGINQEISYSFSNLVAPNIKELFSIDPNSGEVRVTGNVDFEESTAYDIQVEATDKSVYPLSGHCRVLIEVLDVNDNTPEMSLKSLSVPVPEDSPLGTVVALISISDRDSGVNGQVSCSMNPARLPFKLLSTFKNYYSLVLSELLDREREAEYKLVLTAQDQGTPSLSATSSLVVPIGDVNDNAPAFTQPTYTVFVKENNPPGAHIFTVSASDPDMAENAQVSYWLDEKLWPLSSYISVHSESGKLYALQPLDYEEIKLLEFQVNARDAGLPSLCGNVTVQVFVVDENDNAPVVCAPAEDAPNLLVVPVAAGHMVGKIRALDADSGYNAWLRYELHEVTTGPWRVGLYSGEISTTRALEEMEGSSSHNLLILVKDHGKPALSATATLSISLVASAQALNTDVHHLRTREGAKPLGGSVNIYLIIAICSVSSLFLLVIIVYMVLKCQCQAKEEMMYGPGTATLVCASEVGSWSYSNRHSHILAGVSGEANGKSDLMVFSPNIPVFAENGKQQDLLCATQCTKYPELPGVLPPQHFMREEDGILLLNKILAVPDASGVEPGNKTQPFYHDKALTLTKGWISNLKERHVLDTFLISLDSMGRRQLLQLVLLHIAWLVGSGQLHYSVPEESQHGTFVGRIAQDLGLEVGELVPRTFRMISKGPTDYFEVNIQNGILFVNSRIDREELCAQSPMCIIHLEVIVDKPLRIFHAEVEIRDINDNVPIFPVNEHKLFILESRLPGSYFPLEGASDADIGPNGLLTYSLRPNDYFQLREEKHGDHSKSLALVLQNSLDREKSPVHHLFLTATDGGQPELTGTLQLEITVLDVNDNVPVFNQSVYEVHLLENITEGTSVLMLTAYDLDEGLNKEIRYSFSNMVPSPIRRIFSIDPATGEIKVKGEVDFEETSLFELQVEAADQSPYPMVGHCKVLIHILDVNDNAPELSVTSLSVPVLESSPSGTVVALISVSDRDSGINSQVSCSLWPPGLPFKLVSTFKNYYSLVLAEPLDREQVTEYKVVVMAQDQGDPSLSASSSLVIPISDVNDNAPTFMQPFYTVFVKENNPPGAHIFTVSASDPDVAENGLISYWMDEKLWPLTSYISVHSESGKLYALQSLDYEEMKLLEFQVSAKDAGLPSLYGNVTVQVFVVDENDNAPAVTAPAEDTPILLVVPVAAGHMVGKVRALDADSGYNAWLCYELHEGSSGPWRVGLYSGEISTTHAVDEAEIIGSSKTLLVLVKDHGKPVLSATATLSASLVSNAQAVQADAHLPRAGGSPKPLVESVNVYLIIAICSVSSLFLLVVIVYVALRCQCQAKEAMMYGPGTATLVCASEVGSWSYSNRHSHILGGVAGEAGAKSDLMVFSPNVPVFAVNGEVGNAAELVPNSSGEVSPVDPRSLTSIILSIIVV
ncbi:uncharacterized protein [Tiliqua scincoides]|uniref:uncharacterized protein n=1 Tax=Tiliqua scincoides TaxID=71010 RepID=UPI00346240BC